MNLAFLDFIPRERSEQLPNMLASCRDRATSYGRPQQELSPYAWEAPIRLLAPRVVLPLK